ncbi:MAG TPA: M64 family metallopeptidase [Bacteroidales bacterium]|nr:M64 family metallopeptidase [Bacteroidales bacterium]
MKKYCASLVLLLVSSLILPSAYSQTGLEAAASVTLEPVTDFTFDDFFIQRTLRIDYTMAGDYQGETVYLEKMKQEPNWAGPQKHMIDPFDAGTYRYAVYDSLTGKLIYTRGFCNLFEEWQGTPEAKKTRRSFQQTAILPFPKQVIRFEIDKRRYEDGKFAPIFQDYINPNDYFIYRNTPKQYPFVKFREAGDPSFCVDVAFVAEGYTAAEMPKFLDDAKRIGDYFMSVAPYSEFSGSFNMYAIEAPSDESGVDIPGTGVYVNTDVHSTFYTFDMDRYLTCSETWAVYDIAASVPYDAIFILVNSKRYGGGGFYNHMCEGTVDNPLSKIVAVHEFGHAFAGLADEYYTSEVTYSDFYNLKVEPWEANITTNVNFDSKWKGMILPGTPIPTPREDKYKDVVGMFEGGGYCAKGIYSPMMDCRMKSNEAPGFCPVCRERIRNVILYYCE